MRHDSKLPSVGNMLQAACVGALMASTEAGRVANGRAHHRSNDTQSSLNMPRDTQRFNDTQLDLFESATRHSASSFVTQRLQGNNPVCIVDLHMPADKVYAKMSTQNHRDYAAHHDYTYLGYEGLVAGNRFADPVLQGHMPNGCRVHCGGVYFQKLGAMAAAAVETNPHGDPLCDWMMWMDTDAVFTNFNLPVDAVLMHYPETTPRAKDVILSRENTMFDTSFVNSGVFLVKNSERGRAFLEGSAALFEKHNIGGDQNAIQEFVFGVDPRGRPMTERATLEAQLRPEIGLVDQRVMNAFTWENDPLSRGATADSEWQKCDYVAHIASRNRHDRRIKIKEVLATVPSC